MKGAFVAVAALLAKARLVPAERRRRSPQTPGHESARSSYSRKVLSCPQICGVSCQTRSAVPLTFGNSGLGNRLPRLARRLRHPPFPHHADDPQGPYQSPKGQHRRPRKGGHDPMDAEDEEVDGEEDAAVAPPPGARVGPGPVQAPSTDARVEQGQQEDADIEGRHARSSVNDRYNS